MGLKLGGVDVGAMHYNGKGISEARYNGSKVRPTGWKPGENTMLYIPFFEGKLTDESQYHRTITNSGVSISTVGGIKSGYFNGTAKMSSEAYTTSNTKTTIIRFTMPTITTNQSYFFEHTNNSRYALGVYNGAVTFDYPASSSSQRQMGVNPSVSAGTWLMIAYVKNGSVYTGYVFKNSSTPQTTSASGSNRTLNSSPQIGSYNTSRRYTGYIGSIIDENIARTEQNLIDYYNQTKSKFGY